MKRSELLHYLESTNELNVFLPDGSQVPSHFHITEAGLTTRRFIDCGGTTRTEEYATFQIWTADDTDHRLTPEKLIRIIEISENLTAGKDPQVEFEYQMETIGRFGLAFDEGNFILTPKQTDCLAKEQCGISDRTAEPIRTERVSACAPGNGCC